MTSTGTENVTRLSIGFTGTRSGLTSAQFFRLKKELTLVMRDLNEISRFVTGDFTAHHGKARGADSEFHRLVRESWPNVRIVGHPALFHDRAVHNGLICDEDREAKPPLIRDDDIVDESGILLAGPAQWKAVRRGSGTWATVRRAEKAGIPIVIIFPDGKVSKT
jgi:hypothetical protein